MAGGAGRVPKEQECCADRAGVSVPVALSEDRAEQRAEGPAVSQKTAVVRGEHLSITVPPEMGQQEPQSNRGEAAPLQSLASIEFLDP